MMRWLRWLLVVPGAWAAWYVALFAGITVHGALESLCPPEQVVSGMCTAWWFHYAERAVICAAAGLAAALILLTCALIAPSHRSRVVALTLAAGSLVALAMAVLAAAYAEFITAVAVGGLVTVWLLKSAWIRASSNDALERTHPWIRF